MKSGNIDIDKRVCFMYKTSKSPVSGEKLSSRRRVLDLLESGKGSYLSGEYIASVLGLSRTAVWKAVKSLRNEGYSIDAVTNRGYALSPKNDILSADGIRRYIRDIAESGEVSFGVPENAISVINSGVLRLDSIRLEVSDVVDSTNDVCQRIASSGEKGSIVVVAGCQTRGKGRRGRTFFSPDGSGLYMSMLIHAFGINSQMALRLTTIAAVAVAESIEAVADVPAEIKWVNDVYVRGRKVCGILTEASFNLEDSTLDYAVVGIGINVYEPEGGFPESIKDRAGSIASALDQFADPDPDGQIPYGVSVLENGGRNRLAAEIIARFNSYCVSELSAYISGEDDSGSSHRYLDEYRRRCFVIGHEIDVLKAGAAPVRALAIGLDDDCHLIVRYDDGSEEALYSGEISIRV